MGDLANERMKYLAKQGRVWVCPRKSPQEAVCPNCGKIFKGVSGVMQHQNSKHGYTHKNYDIMQLLNKETDANK